MDFDQRKRLFRQGFWLVLGPLGGFLVLGAMLPSWHTRMRHTVAFVYFLISVVSILFGLVRLNRSRDQHYSDALAIGALITGVIGIVLLAPFIFGLISSARLLTAP